MAVVASATGAAVFGLSGVAAGLAGGALLGAGAGALYSGITGDGNILDSALTGALLGGSLGGLGAAFAPAAAGGTGLTAATAPLTGTGALAPGAASTVSSSVPALATTKGTLGATAFSPSAAAAQQAAFGLGATAPVAGALPVASTYGTFVGAGAPAGLATTQTLSGLGAGSKVAAGMTGKQMLATGLAGTTALSLLGNRNQSKLSSATGTTPSYIRPYTYSSTPVPAGDEYPSPYPSTPLYNAQGNPILDTRERNYFDQTFTAGEPYEAANGGLMTAYQAGGPVERMSMMNTAMNPQGGLYPMGMIDKTQYATPTQRPVSSELIMNAPAYDRSNPMLMAKGGQAEDDESYIDRMRRIKQMNNMLDEIKETGRVAPPDFGEYIPTMKEYKPSRLNVMAMPQAFVDAPQTKGVMGRIGGSYALDRDTQLLGGLSGFAGRDRGALTVRPSTADVGIARRMGPGILAAQYERSLTGQQPPRYMANYNIPYAEGGQVKGYAAGGVPDFGNGYNPFANLPSMSGPLGAVGSGMTQSTISPMTLPFMGMPATGGPGAPPPIMNHLFNGTNTTTQEDIMGGDRRVNPLSFSEIMGGGLSKMLNQPTGQSTFPGASSMQSGFGQGAQGYPSFSSGSGGGAGGGGGPFPLEGQYGIIKMAEGGNIQGYNLGGYSDGGRLLRGPGDGVSDDIPAVIGNRQPARLADGEFVIPARIVSELGNGSTDAGAKRLYAMMDRIQSGRKKTIGKNNVAKDTKAKKHLLA